MKTKYIFSSLILLLFIVFLNNCIDPFDPDVQEEKGLLTVEGSLVKGQEKQVIKISRASSVYEPKYIPVEGCKVFVYDNMGNSFEFTESSNGEYIAYIDDDQLHYNADYKLYITSPSGEIYESKYQTLLQSEPVDSFYYIEESQYIYSTSTELINGLQFYVDLKASEEGSKFYRWKLEETWENRARYWIQGYYDGINTYFTRIDSLYRCWDSDEILGIFATSTLNQSSNEKKRIPLNFIEESDKSKYTVRYCISLLQYALNEDAYNYWNDRIKEIEESDGFYTIQPNQYRSNIQNINNSNEQVLGYFWVSSCTKKDIYLVDPFHTKVLSDACELFGVFDPSLYNGPLPVYIFGNDSSDVLVTPVGGVACFDCRLKGGSTNKPDFWVDE